MVMVSGYENFLLWLERDRHMDIEDLLFFFMVLLSPSFVALLRA